MRMGKGRTEKIEERRWKDEDREMIAEKIEGKRMEKMRIGGEGQKR